MRDRSKCAVPRRRTWTSRRAALPKRLSKETVEVEAGDLRSRLAARSAVEWRLTRRQRARRLGVAVGVVLLALCTLLATIPGIHDGAAGVVARLLPTPTVVLPAGANRLYIELDVPRATVALDNAALRLPRIGVDPPLVLGRGRHRLDWTAPGFLPQMCILSVPHAASDNCLFAPESLPSQGSTVAVRVVWLQESWATLATDQQGVLLQAMQTALDARSASSLVQRGEPYGTAAGLATATQALTATLSYQADIEAVAEAEGGGCNLSLTASAEQPCEINGQSCLSSLCSVPWNAQQSLRAARPGLGWLVFAPVFSSWSYTTESGRVIASDDPVNATGEPVRDHLVLLDVTWMSPGWKVTPLFPRGPTVPVVVNDGVQVAYDPACIGATVSFAGELPGYTQVRYISGANPAAGCLIAATPTTIAAPVPSGPAYFLQRCGVLVAVNSVAHRLLPSLPVADAYEQGLVERLKPLVGMAVLSP